MSEPVASAEYEETACCLVTLGSFSLRIFKNALDKLHFIEVKNLVLVIHQQSDYVQNSITRINK